ncbi:hypothetical protein GO491_10765 [Flavobacteriaceae bacterium Ap0902]|nr:hypothetical protein [Flavobacteriaceae bacterium Ap0902]
MDYIIVILLLTFGYFLKDRYKTLNTKDFVLLDQLYVYHMIMSFVFYLYIRTNGGDAQGYWKIAKEIYFEELWTKILLGNTSASDYVYLICYLPSNILNLDFFTGTMLFGLLGYWGILLMIVTLKELFPLIQYVKHIKFLGVSIFPTILFLPNFHFWSGGVGKDTLLFFCACAFFYAINNLKKRWWMLLFIIAIAYPIRPHILLFLLAGFATSFILKSKMYLVQKILITIVAFILFLPLLNNVLEFAKIDDASVESFSQFSESKSGALSRSAGSSVDIGNLPYPLQVFTFLYRPLFFDAPNALGLLASIENVAWILLTAIFLRNKPIRVFKSSHFIILSSFLYWLIGALAFAPILGNLGIIIRERNMFLPGFIIFAVAGLYNTTKFKKFEFYYQNILNKPNKQKQKIF